MEKECQNTDDIDAQIDKLYTPKAKRAKEFGALVSAQTPLPGRGLIEYWMNKPDRLAARLQTLCYAPAKTVCLSHDRNITETLNHLFTEALTDVNFGIESVVEYEPRFLDLLVVNGSSRQGSDLIFETARKGVAVVAACIPEDMSLFSGRDNIYPFSGSGVLETERFFRDVLAMIRHRLYRGEI